MPAVKRMAVRISQLRRKLKMNQDKDAVKLDAIAIKSLCSHTKMKTRKQLASPEASRDIKYIWCELKYIFWNII